MSHSHCVSFQNGNAETLHGILQMPATRVHSSLGIVLLSPGQKSRIGPWLSYVQLARRIAALGVPVLRFDYHGLGDSEGSHRHGQTLVDFNGFVQTGGLARDVIAAADFFATEAGVKHFVFVGLCGGASTGLIAAQHIEGVYGHVLVDLPVTVSNSARQRYLEQNAAELLRLRPEESRGVLQNYFARLRDPAAWKRFLSGASDYALLIEAVKRVSSRGAAAMLSRIPFIHRRTVEPVAPPPQPTSKQPSGEDERVNETAVSAFHSATARGQKIFFLNSSAYQPMFDRYFAREHLAGANAHPGIGLLTVPETNHVLSAEHGQRALFECVDEFVRNAIAELAERPSALQRLSRRGSSLVER